MEALDGDNWSWQYLLAEMSCIVFPPLYRTCLADNFSFSHIGDFKSDIPNRDRNTMIFHTHHQKMHKSAEPYGAEPAILQDTVRSV